MLSSLREKQRKINHVTRFIKTATEDRSKALSNSLEASRKFWPGLEKLQETLLVVQKSFDAEEEPRCDPNAIKELQLEHEVCFFLFLATFLQHQADSHNKALAALNLKFVKTNIFLYEYDLRPQVPSVFYGFIWKFSETFY